MTLPSSATSTRAQLRPPRPRLIGEGEALATSRAQRAPPIMNPFAAPARAPLRRRFILNLPAEVDQKFADAVNVMLVDALAPTQEHRLPAASEASPTSLPSVATPRTIALFSSAGAARTDAPMTLPPGGAVQVTAYDLGQTRRSTDRGPFRAGRGPR